MIGPRPIPDARTAGAAKEEVGGVAAGAGILPHLRFFFAIDADLPGGETDLCGKGAAAARLALAAMADRHADRLAGAGHANLRSEAHTSELQSLMRISYAVFCLKKKTKHNRRED